jgi:hypothetical protein
MMKNSLQCCRQIWTHCFSVVTYDIASHYRKAVFLHADPDRGGGQAIPNQLINGSTKVQDKEINVSGQICT